MYLWNVDLVIKEYDQAVSGYIGLHRPECLSAPEVQEGTGLSGH